MPTYVTSLHGQARRAHIGTSYWTACGFIVGANFVESDSLPEGRTVCPRCAARYEPTAPKPRVIVREPGTGSALDAAQELATTYVQRRILALLREGLDNPAIALSLGLGLRTVTRHTSAMQEQAGARSRFQWGYLVCLADGRIGTNAPPEQ